jgi:hypothetical protein
MAADAKYQARVSIRFTCMALHSPARAVLIPLPFSPAAICRRETAPAAFNSSMMGARCAVVSLGNPGRNTGPGSFLGHSWQIATIPAQPLPTGPGSGQSILRAGGDGLGLMLSHGGQNVHRQAVGLGEVNRGELDPAFHQVGDEGDVTGQAIQFGDDQGCAMQTAQAQRLGQLRPVVALAALHHLGHELPGATVEVGPHGLLLGLEPKAGAPLLGGADPVVGDELASPRLGFSVETA